MTEPLLPYDGTSGWSGSETSRERAYNADGSGETADRQKATMEAIHSSGERGMTWKEISQTFGWHHGKASGVLSVLHKENKIARLLDEKRDRCAVYVCPGHIGGRETVHQGRHNPLQEALVLWLTQDDSGWCEAARDPMGFAKEIQKVTGIS